MGRTVPTFVQLIQQAAERWKKFRRALRREDQPHFDRLFVRVRCYTQAATYQCHDNPMEAILLSIALDHAVRENRGALQSRSGSEARAVSCSEDAGSCGEDAARSGKAGDVAIGSPEFPP